MGQVIGNTEAFVSAPIHSSVSGKVTGIETQRNAMGGNDTLVVIETDKKQELAEDIKEYFISIDKAILLEIHRWHTPFWDDFFYIFSGQKVWLITALTIVYAIIRSYRKESWVVFLAIAVLITLSDQLSQ